MVQEPVFKASAPRSYTAAGGRPTDNALNSVQPFRQAAKASAVEERAARAKANPSKSAKRKAGENTATNGKAGQKPAKQNKLLVAAGVVENLDGQAVEGAVSIATMKAEPAESDKSQKPGNSDNKKKYKKNKTRA